MSGTSKQRPSAWGRIERESMMPLLQDCSAEAVAHSRAALDAALADYEQVDLPAESLSAHDEWALPLDELQFLSHVVRRLKPRHIVEFGSGTSTRGFARASMTLDTPCYITSVDHDADFRRNTLLGLASQRMANCQVALQFAPLVQRECGGKLLPVYRLRPHRFASRRPADLVLIDGPPVALGGREGTLYQVLDFARSGTVVLLDDANRAEERAILARWQDNLGEAIEVRLLPQFSHGMAAILVREPVAASELWNHRLRLCQRDIERLIPPGDTFILVDQNCGGDQLGPNRHAIPFLEKNGEYFGPPADDATAIHEVERWRDLGATFIVFVWPAFWWLEHYTELHAHLRSGYRCVLENDRLVIFELRP